MGRVASVSLVAAGWEPLLADMQALGLYDQNDLIDWWVKGAKALHVKVT